MDPIRSPIPLADDRSHPSENAAAPSPPIHPTTPPALSPRETTPAAVFRPYFSKPVCDANVGCRMRSRPPRTNLSNQTVNRTVFQRFVNPLRPHQTAMSPQQEIRSAKLPADIARNQRLYLSSCPRAPARHAESRAGGMLLSFSPSTCQAPA